jgi:hypothetical protein
MLNVSHTSRLHTVDKHECDDHVDNQTQYSLLSTRTIYALPVRTTERTKSISRPLAVVQTGIHIVPVLLRPFTHVDVHVDAALLIHVRSGMNPSEDVLYANAHSALYVNQRLRSRPGHHPFM